MAFEYFLFRTDYDNTLVDRGATSFAPLPPNTGEIYIDFFIPENQPLYFYKEDSGSIILNDESTIELYLNSVEIESPDSYVTYGQLTGYTANTSFTSETIKKPFFKTSHGFTIGTVVEYSGGTFIKALAVEGRNSEIVGLVNEVIDSNNFSLIMSGYINGLTGLSANSTYFVSPTVQGGLTNIEPTEEGTITKPILITFSATDGLVVQYRAFINISGITGSTSTFVTDAKFDTYTGDTESRLDDIEGDVIYLSGQTASKVGNTKFNSYTGTTNTRLNGIEDDIIYLSGQTSGVSNSLFTGYTATTEVRIDGIEDDIIYLSGQTASKVSNTKFNTYTGTTAPNQYASKSAFLTFTGTTAPATYQSKSSIVVLTGTTLPNTYASKSAFLTFTGTTAPATYQSKASIVTYTGTTAPAQFAAKSNFNTYTGTTAPNQFASKTIFNSYTGTTNSAINNRLLTTIFNGYTGTTAPATYQTKSSINTLTGTTLPATYQSKSSINIYTGTTAPNQFAAKSAFLLFTGTTAPATYQSKSSIATYTGTTAPNQFAAKTNFNTHTGTTVNSGNNGLTKSGTNLRLGGSLTGNTTITTATGSRLNFAGWPVQYSTDLSANYNIRSLVDRGYVTGITTTLTTTGNNGITKSGQNFRLGGTLTGATTIISPATGSRLSFSGFPVQYAADYSANFNPRSLVDKAYVTGLTSANVYGTEYQLASDLASTATNSTTPIAKVTMNTINLPAGTYKITVSWIWNRNSTANSARFDITIGGVAQGTRQTMEIEIGDTSTFRPETRVLYVALSGINTIVFNHWGETGGNSTTTSDATIELIRVA